MARPHLEVADVLNAHGDAYVARHRGHLSRGQLKLNLNSDGLIWASSAV
jgi:hypothetical protein